MHEAEIFRRHELGGDTAVLVGLHLRDLVGDRSELAAEIFGDRRLPASLHGGPDELDFLIGREAFAAHDHRRAHGTMLRRHAQTSHKAAGRLADRHFRSELGRSRRGGRGGVERERKRKRIGKRSHSPIYDAEHHADSLPLSYFLAGGGVTVIAASATWNCEVTRLNGSQVRVLPCRSVTVAL